MAPLPSDDSDRTRTVTSVPLAPDADTPKIDQDTGRTTTRPGDRFGRYTVRSLLGSGGMGQVFAAVDPELARTIALKLIRADRDLHPLARARLLREAQALARLHHPNVVTVHDVGTQGEQVYVAMELVEGPTLEAWLRERARSWREILPPFLAAGRGLAAAHAAGIIHRDFKPLNVIVAKDRVVVLDFGLARAGTEEEPAESPGQRTVLETDLTLTGEAMGTPRYMAPEQRASGEVTAKADQYGFCVALWEGLHGSLPGGTTRPEVPRWLNAAVTRGLASHPDDRWPSMDGLLAVLGRNPAATRRRIASAAAVVALAGVATWGLLRTGSVDPCAGGAERLAGVWGGPRREAVRAAFDATRLPFAGDAWRGASTRVDEYAAAWVDMQREACRSTRVDGRQSDTMMDLRMACLDRRRATLGALTDLWAKGMDGKSLAAAVEAAGALPPLGECADARALIERGPLPADAATRARIDAARVSVDAVRALLLAGQLPEARKDAAAARAQAEATGWASVRAEAAFAEADALRGLQDPAAEPILLDTVRLAAEAHDDLLAARALIETVDCIAQDHQESARALTVADIADAMVARVGRDPQLVSRLLRYRGNAWLALGKYPTAEQSYRLAGAFSAAAFGADALETVRIKGSLAAAVQQQGLFAAARRLHEENLATAIRLLGAEHPRVSQILVNLAAAARDGGDLEAAAGYYRRALAIDEKTNDPDSAATALTLNNFGSLQIDRGELDDAQRLLQRALQIRERALGPGHPYVASTLGSLARVMNKQGRHDQAMDLLQRALAILTQKYGASHPRRGFILSNMGDVFLAKGDLATALDWYRQALEVRRTTLGPDHPFTLQSMGEVAGALAAQNRCAEARPLLATAIPAQEKRVGADDLDLAPTLTVAARCDLAEGRPAQALAALDRAMTILDEGKAPPIDRGRSRWLRAQALWSLHRREEALAEARRAETELAGDAEGARDRAAAKAWLAVRR